MLSESVDLITGDFQRIQGSLPGRGTAWVDRARGDALDWFSGRGFPTARDEDWKYTNVAAIERRPMNAVTVPNPVSAERVRALAFADLPCHLVVFGDGRFDPTFSAISALPDGVSVRSLAEVIAHDGPRLEPLLAGEPGNAFAALNLAFMTDGVVIELSRNTVVEQPIHLLYFASQPETSVHYRNLIIADENAQATVVEHYVGPDGSSYLTNVVTTILGAANAASSTTSCNRRARRPSTSRGSTRPRPGTAASRRTRSRSGARSRGTTSRVASPRKGPSAPSMGSTWSEGDSSWITIRRIDHAKPHGTSREHYRGVLDGASRGIFNGKVMVHPDAQHTDAQQSNHNLLLSKAAEVDTKPQLEIYADDVKCTHGATVGQLDDSMMFYLRSRGIEQEVAKALLIYAFAHDIIGRIRLDPLRHRISGT